MATSQSIFRVKSELGCYMVRNTSQKIYYTASKKEAVSGYYCEGDVLGYCRLLKRRGTQARNPEASELTSGLECWEL